ncbi:hypothetical protein D3C83_197480 [compost metagenome]
MLRANPAQRQILDAKTVDLFECVMMIDIQFQNGHIVPENRVVPIQLCLRSAMIGRWLGSFGQFG